MAGEAIVVRGAVPGPNWICVLGICLVDWDLGGLFKLGAVCVPDEFRCH